MSTFPWKFSVVGSIQTIAGKSGDYLHGPTADNVRIYLASSYQPIDVHCWT